MFLLGLEWMKLNCPDGLPGIQGDLHASAETGAGQLDTQRTGWCQSFGIRQRGSGHGKKYPREAGPNKQ